MGKICEYAELVADDFYLCTKYKSYCYLENPDKKKCVELYGDNYTNDSILEDEENNEDCI